MTGQSIKFVVVIVLAVFCIENAVVSQDDEIRKESFAEFLRAENQGLPAASIDEIVRIRQRLGGGTGLELTGLIDDKLIPKSDSAPFSGQPRSLLDCERPEPQMAATHSERLFFEMIAQTDELDFNFTAVSLPANWNKQISSIRDSARRIEQIAADLEEMNLFKDADALRTQANRIRRKARNTVRSANFDRSINR